MIPFGFRHAKEQRDMSVVLRFKIYWSCLLCDFVLILSFSAFGFLLALPIFQARTGFAKGAEMLTEWRLCSHFCQVLLAVGMLLVLSLSALESSRCETDKYSKKSATIACCCAWKWHWSILWHWSFSSNGLREWTRELFEIWTTNQTMSNVVSAFGHLKPCIVMYSTPCHTRP